MTVIYIYIVIIYILYTFLTLCFFDVCNFIQPASTSVADVVQSSALKLIEFKFEVKVF